MDNEPTIVRVPSPPRRGASVLVVIGAIVLGLAILKPWTLGAAPAGVALPLPTAGLTAFGPPLATPRPSVPAPTPTPIPDPNAMACMSSEGNRVLALVRAPGVEIRTWLTLADLSLANPLDPGVASLRLPSSNVIGLGICARRIDASASTSSAATIVDVQVVAVGGGSARDLGAPRLVTRQLGDPAMGVLYGPPAPIAGGSGSAVPTGSATSPGASAADLVWPSWPYGDYALEFRLAGDPTTLARWIRLELVPAVGQYG